MINLRMHISSRFAEDKGTFETTRAERVPTLLVPTKIKAIHNVICKLEDL